MALTTNAEVNAAIERLCRDGCKSVREYIAALESGDNHPAFAHLASEQRTQLLAELKAIMAVYGDNCRV